MSARGFEVCDRLLALAAKLGASASVSVRESEVGHVRFAAGEITTSGEVSTTTARLTLAFGPRHAKAETNQVGDLAAVRAFVDRTASLASIAPDDPEYMPPLGPERYAESPRAWDDATAALAPASRAASARAAIDEADARELVGAGYVESRAEALTLANSAGLRAQHRGTCIGMTTTARSKDGAGSGWAGAEGTRAAEIDARSLARIASDKAERSRHATKLDPGRYTVILEPAAVADLFGFLIEALDARAADQGRSYFSRPGGGNRVGEALFDPRVVLRSDPFDPATPACPWDDDGIALHPTTWIEEGRLATLHHTRFWAHKMGKAPTGAHGAYTLACPSGAPSAASLTQGVRRGLVVTRFWYTRWLDPKQLLVTGLTRDGVWLVEDGKTTRPVNNFRFNESPVTMLSHLVGATATTYRVPAGGAVMRVPVLCCNDFEMASVSDAV